MSTLLWLSKITDSQWQKVTRNDLIIWAVFCLALKQHNIYNSFAICYVNSMRDCVIFIFSRKLRIR